MSQEVKTDVFLDVTEMTGYNISKEQLQRMYTRYAWACRYVFDKDVIEVACGSGQGLGMLAAKARSIRAGDYSPEVLAVPRSHYGQRIDFQVFSAEKMPYEDQSADVILLYEAIYYLPDINGFIEECQRVLRPGGMLLISMANCDLFDFNPSPFSHQYYGVTELNELLSKAEFHCAFFGDTKVSEASMLQRILRPVKTLAVKYHLIPKSMKAKEWLKRVIFGGLVPMPAELKAGDCEDLQPVAIPDTEADLVHKVILCEATLQSDLSSDQ